MEVTHSINEYAVCSGERRMRFLVVVLCVMFLCVPAVADQTPVGDCGGVTWTDDPDLVARLYLVDENDLPILSQVIEQIKENCVVVSVNLFQKDNCRQTARFECAVIVASCEDKNGPLILDLTRK